MEITARKKSTDPIQENLRTHKDKWNVAAREFISRMIAFKRGLNGRGDAHYSLPPGNIKDPLPDAIGSFLNTLASNFEQLVAEALKIEQEQAAYSSTRKKPTPAGQANPQAAPSAKTASAKTANLKIGEHMMPTLLAVTAEEQELGLMNRPWPPPVMSFVYSSPRINRFWMKSTPSPLDIVFSNKGKITAIYKGEPHSTAMVGDYEFTDLVVELPFGTCKKLGIKIGDEMKLLNSVSDIIGRFEKKYGNY